MQAKISSTLAREVIERFVGKGREAAVAALRRYGEERGRRIAERAAAEGLDNTFASFLACSDLGTGYLQMLPEIEDGALRTTICYCLYTAACREWMREEYGKYFCRETDAAIMGGYNPDR